MTERVAGGAPLLLELDPAASDPLYRQLYDGVREAILSGRLRAGSRLPSTRALADDLDVSRTTVVSAYRRLTTEGYLEARVGSGTRVADDVRESPTDAAEPAVPAAGAEEGSRRALSDRGGRAEDLTIPAPRFVPDGRPFQLGIPALDRFPVSAWARITGRRWRRASHELLTYAEPEGHRPLREAVATYVRASRGVRCEAGQVLIVSGTQQGLDLAARVLLDPGDPVWLEEPGYPGARGALTAAGARVVAVPVDEAGLAVAAGEAAEPASRAVYVSPSHQFPLGVTMSLPRRLALLRWASRNEAWILEDDYDAEYRHGGRPLMALQGLDRAGRVIYLGSFSKTLFPALRLGFVVLPPDLVDPFVATRAQVDQQSPTLPQAILAEFISEGHFARHVRRMRNVYGERREALLEAIDDELGGIVDPGPSEAGLHLVGHLPKGIDDTVAARAARDRGLEVLALSRRYHGAPPEVGGLILGYGSADPDALRDGVRKLAGALEEVR